MAIFLFTFFSVLLVLSVFARIVYVPLSPFDVRMPVHTTTDIRINRLWSVYVFASTLCSDFHRIVVCRHRHRFLHEQHFVTSSSIASELHCSTHKVLTKRNTKETMLHNEETIKRIMATIGLINQYRNASPKCRI